MSNMFPAFLVIQLITSISQIMMIAEYYDYHIPFHLLSTT